MNELKGYINILLETLSKKNAILMEIVDISKKQAELINGDNFDNDAFIETISVKQGQIEKLNQLDEGFDSVYARAKESMANNKKDFKFEIIKLQELIKTGVDLSMQIKTLENRNQTGLQRVLSQNRKEIKTFRTSSKVATSYYKTMAQSNVVDSYFLDKKN